MNRLRLGSVAVVLIVALLLSATLFGAQAQGGVLRVGMDAPVVLDPAQGSNDPETAFNRAIYDYLVEVLPDSSIALNLANDWNVSDDGLTYTFQLVENATFHDGSPFTSADVVFTFNRLKEVGSSALRLLGEFEVTADGDYTVVFTLPQPNADFLYGVASRFALILKDGTATPNEIVEGDNPYVNFNGTGPFMLTEYTPGVGGLAVFVRNPNYFKEGQPALDGLELVFFSSDSVTQVDALLSGQVDLVFKVPVGLVVDRNLESEAGVVVIQQQTSQHGVIRLRTDVGPGTDVQVRQAFKYATDRQALNDALLFGRGTVGHNDPIAPAYGVFYDSSLQDQPYDPAEACRLLADAGYPDGLQMTLYYPRVFEYADLALLLRDQWAEGCIQVEVVEQDPGLYYDTNNEINWCDVELGMTGWGDRPTPQLFMLEAYVTAAIDDGSANENGISCVNGYNESRWSDPELDALVEQAGLTADAEARKAIYAQIAAIFQERGPIIVPYFAPMMGVASASVQGLVLAPFPGLTDYRGVTVSG